jgi:hypothetical protein
VSAPSDFLSREFTRPIAERELVLVTAGTERPITVRLGEPVQDVPTAGGNDWRCPIQIEGSDRSAPPPGVGVDALQALLHGIKMIHIHLARIERQSGGVLHWLGEPGHFVPDLPLTG